jgi:Asp-tRNA(Asn)/Glu-tRNA(Gln) amidotransferase A subunit family amidase
LPAQRKFFGDTAAEASYAADLERLEALGAEIVEVDFEPLHAVARLLYEGPWVAERYAATRTLLEASPDSFHPVTRRIIEGARGLTAVSVFEATYRLMDLKRDVAPLLSASIASPCRPCRAPIPWRNSPPIRSPSTPTSAAIPTSSTCSISPRCRCPPALAPTACAAA